MHGNASGPVSEAIERCCTDLRNSYDMRAHTRGDSRQAGVLTEAFIDRFAVVGHAGSLHRALAAPGRARAGQGGSGRFAARRFRDRCGSIAALIESEVLPACAGAGEVIAQGRGNRVSAGARSHAAAARRGGRVAA